MRATSAVLTTAFLLLSLLTFGGPCVACLAQAEDADLGLVPEPWIHETHEYDVPGEIDGTPTDEFFVNEKWSIEVRHGDVMTLIMARNITQGDATSVDYQNNIHYYIGGKLYIAQFMIMEVVFYIGGYELHAPLGTCSGFEVEHSPTTYDGTVPTLDCNFIFKGVHIYQDGTLPAEYSASTVDLTLVHHIRANWNDTRVKVEAILDFSDTRFYDPGSEHSEFAAGEQFTAEIWYAMMLANPEDFRTSGPVTPTSCTNSTLEYNMTLDSGTPLTMSKLNMDNNFTAYDAGGLRSLTGYSLLTMDENGFARASHGFPNLTYDETLSMQSDPEITVYHDMVTEAYRPASEYYWLIVPVIGAAVAVGLAFATIKMRKKRKTH